MYFAGYLKKNHLNLNFVITKEKNLNIHSNIFKSAVELVRFLTTSN